MGILRKFFLQIENFSWISGNALRMHGYIPFSPEKKRGKSKGVTIGHAMKKLLRRKTARKGNAVHIAAVGAQVDFVAPYGAAVDGGVNVPGNAVVFVQIHPAKGFPHTKGGKNSALPKQGPHVVEPCFFVTEFQYQGEIIPCQR